MLAFAIGVVVGVGWTYIVGLMMAAQQDKRWRERQKARGFDNKYHR